jgi:hypothetical protein
MTNASPLTHLLLQLRLVRRFRPGENEICYGKLLSPEINAVSVI